MTSTVNLTERISPRKTSAKPVQSQSPESLLRQLTDQSIVLAEDLGNLPADVQDQFNRCADSHDLLVLLVNHNLLTQYQAQRIEAGKSSGLILGHYRVLDRLGAGAMGVVFKAEHVDMRRPVAIKVLPVYDEQPPIVERRFVAEIRAVAQLQHPNIVAAIDSGKCTFADAPALRYLVMEYVTGQDLEQYIVANGPMEPAQACAIIHQVAAALAEADKHRLVHRDIKPSNIFLTPDGQAKLLDFGLALNDRQRMTEPGTVLGTLAYMAPEQIGDAASVDIRADIYALGATLFWCLTGGLPFPPRESIVQEALHRQTDPPPSLLTHRPDLPRDLDEILARIMAVCPEDRIGTPQEVMEVLVPFIEEETHSRRSLHLPPVALPEDVDLTPRQHRILIVDDEPEIRRFCRYALQAKDGPEIDEAEDGVQALAMLGERGYDLVVTDLCMPGMAGSELCGRIRENLARPKLANLKIIVMSGGASPDEMANMTLQVADDYVTKPVSVVQLRAKVAAALRLKDAQDRSDLLSAHLAAGNQDLQKALAQRDLDLISARKSVVGALLNTISLREGQGSAHCQRMERYCRCLAEEAAKETVFADAIDTAFIESLATGAPLHDIGNIALPDNIRLKAGELSPNERLLMQTHTTTGAELLQILVNQHGMVFLRTAAEIARHHHERFDGGGYPDGLAGNEIPLAARLVAICDVYDALRSRRSYKPPMSHAAAVRVITNISRKQFDPALLPAFERCAPSFERIFTELSPT